MTTKHMKTSGLLCLEDLQLIQAHQHTKLDELVQQQRQLREQARAHALATALEYYEVGSDYLKELVFQNWLDEHAFAERFKPLRWD